MYVNDSLSADRHRYACQSVSWYFPRVQAFFYMAVFYMAVFYVALLAQLVEQRHGKA